MNSSIEEIASKWKGQMQKGYLKLATLFVLTKGPSHGYQMMRYINEITLGMITPTAGGLYPTLKELENKGLIKGEWVSANRKKVYYITDKGIEVFRAAVERHFRLASSIRGWFLKALADLDIIKETDLPSVMEPVISILLLKENASTEEKVKALEELRERLGQLTLLLQKMVDQISIVEANLKSTRQTQ